MQRRYVSSSCLSCGNAAACSDKQERAEACAADTQVRRLNMYKKTATRDRRGKILHQV